MDYGVKMSVVIKILHERDWNGREYAEAAIRDPRLTSDALSGVIGYVVAALVKHPSDGAVTLERAIAVTADNAEDNGLAESVVKTIERKLNEAFPDPNQQIPEVKLWIPDGN
jgi:hypothetical protein